MFCSKSVNTNESLSCAVKWISEIISFFSIIFSLIIIVITATKTKPNIINKLILQILISEVIDGFSILLVIFDDYQGPKIFENRNLKTYACFTQIYLSVFTCFWTLTASFFISLRMYDIMVKRNQIFKNKIFEKYISLISIGIPAVFSYIFWIIQVSTQSKRLRDLTKSEYYQSYHSHDHYRNLNCWVELPLTIVLFVFAIILIGANIYFSIIKGSTFLNKIYGELKDKEENNEGHNLKKKIDNMEHIKKTLYLYPLTSGIIWFLFYILQIIFLSKKGNSVAISWCLCLLLSIRLSVYVLLFFFTHKEIENQFLKFVLCKNYRKKNQTINSINDVNEGDSIVPDNESSKKS